MKVTVTEEDIAKGIRNDSCYCPIALALKRAYGTLFVIVDDDRITIYSKSIKTYKKLIKFINDFDYFSEVKPFTFNCRIEI